jgi:hypothetical protein
LSGTAGEAAPPVVACGDTARIVWLGSLSLCHDRRGYFGGE